MKTLHLTLGTVVSYLRIFQKERLVSSKFFLFVFQSKRVCFCRVSYNFSLKIRSLCSHFALEQKKSHSGSVQMKPWSRTVSEGRQACDGLSV